MGTSTQAVDVTRPPHEWRERSGERMPDVVWHATVARIRAEFAEMPCLRVTPSQAGLLFGLSGTAVRWIFGVLNREGFLMRSESGEYMRRTTAP